MKSTRGVSPPKDVLLELERQDDDVFAWAKRHVTFMPLEERDSGQRDRVDELDVQGIVAFAERILPRASDL